MFILTRYHEPTHSTRNSVVKNAPPISLKKNLLRNGRSSFLLKKHMLNITFPSHPNLHWVPRKCYSASVVLRLSEQQTMGKFCENKSSRLFFLMNDCYIKYTSFLNLNTLLTRLYRWLTSVHRLTYGSRVFVYFKDVSSAIVSYKTWLITMKFSL